MISNDSLKIDNVEHVDNLRFNLLSVGQICDNKCRVTFSKHDSEITKDGKVIGRGIRKKGLYVMKLGNKPKDKICLATIDENSTLWHRRLGHANMCLIQSLASKELVRNLPKLKFDQHFCDACKIGKQAHASHKAKNIVSTTRCLELLHMDLFGPSAVRSYGGNRYTLVNSNDLNIRMYNSANKKRVHDKKLILKCNGEFCNANGITHNFSAPRTPQSNGVVERKNRTLQEMSRTMLNEQSLPQKFWCNAVDTLTYILNQILIRAILGKTPYELLRGRKPTLDYFKVFGSKRFILNTKDYLTKFDLKSYEGVFLGYSQNSKAYIILNKHTRKIKESLNVTFDETPPPFKTSPLVDDDLDEEEAIKVTKKKILENVTRVKKQKRDDEDERLLSIFKQIHINLPFLEAMIHMPKRSKVLKDLFSHKEKHEKAASSVKLSEECSTIIQRSLPQKGNPRKLTLPCLIGPLAVKNALDDLGASINLMSHSLFRRLGMSRLKPTRMSIQLADRSIKYPIVVCENLLVKVNFMRPFPLSSGNKYILVAIDYVSKWVEAQAFPTSDARNIVNFLKRLFAQFGILKALISDRGTYFCNYQMEKAMKRYGVVHRFSTAYHP
ncbi:retrovirus-related pol polyprotein from transposon TNT 1-94 [Tanacetum coccineum]